MNRRALLMVVLSLLTATCGERVSIPFDLQGDVRLVLADWKAAGLSCGDPQVGMPGPAADWVCGRDFDGVAVTARLIADSVGVQSIHVGVPGGTPGPDAARAFVELLRATSLVSPDQQELEDWLVASNAADGEMPLRAESAVARAAVARDSEGDPILYVVPLGSSMLLAE
jgi:hypothetical protein